MSDGMVHARRIRGVMTLKLWSIDKNPENNVGWASSVRWLERRLTQLFVCAVSLRIRLPLSVAASQPRLSLPSQAVEVSSMRWSTECISSLGHLVERLLRADHQ